MNRNDISFDPYKTLTDAKEPTVIEHQSLKPTDAVDNMQSTDKIKFETKFHIDMPGLLTDVQSTTTSRKQKRVRGLKRRASPMHLSDDLRYHPKKLDVRSVLAGSKKNKLVQEISKQEQLIKAQGQDLTKKYQLLHSDLEKLLRSTSEETGVHNNSPIKMVTSCS